MLFRSELKDDVMSDLKNGDLRNYDLFKVLLDVYSEVVLDVEVPEKAL